MNETTTAGTHRPSQVHFRHHGSCWALPVALALLAPLTYGISLVPAALRTVQLLRRRSWLGEASVITVRGLFWRSVTQMPLADIEFVHMKPGRESGRQSTVARSSCMGRAVLVWCSVTWRIRKTPNGR